MSGQDPVISQVKLIAEPWDLGAGGYQAGNVPVLWTEWNGKYRDGMRAFWKGEDRGVAELATRIAGSNDLYERIAHDGFTLHDLVSYNHKHNEANGDDNRDGNALGEVDERGRQVRGDTILILPNAHHDEVPFALPTVSSGTAWIRTPDTIAPCVEEHPYEGGEQYQLQGRTPAAVVLRTAPRRCTSDASGEPIVPGHLS